VLIDYLIIASISLIKLSIKQFSLIASFRAMYLASQLLSATVFCRRDNQDRAV
jgi:hypothetical protein